MKTSKNPLLIALDPFATNTVGMKNALKTTITFARALEAPVRATAVVSPDQLLWPRDFDRPWWEEYRQLGDEALKATLKTAAPGEKIVSKALLQPWHSIKESAKTIGVEAAKQKAAALVVYTHYKKKSAFALPGNFVSTVISFARTPVLAINARSAATARVRKILFATDLTKGDGRAFVQAIQWAKNLGSELLIFHAVTFPAQPGVDPAVGMVGGWANLDAYMKEEEAWAKSQGAKWVRKAERSGVKARFLLANTSFGPASVILKAAERERADLISIAVKRGPTAAIFLGSVTRDVLAKATKPVLVLHGSSK